MYSVYYVTVGPLLSAGLGKSIFRAKNRGLNRGLTVVASFCHLSRVNEILSVA